MSLQTKDLFISYGRRESLGFVAKLHQKLKLAGYEVWFDKVNIPDGDDYAQRINNGIESADNFVFVLAPRCLTSVYCLIELEYAHHLGKRIIPLNQEVIFEAPNNRDLSAGEVNALESFFKAYQLPIPKIKTVQDVINRAHELLGRRDWLDGKEKLTDNDCDNLKKWADEYENHWAKHEDIEYLKSFIFPQFGESIDALDSVLERLTHVVERQKAYVQLHTTILLQSLHWTSNQKETRHLLVGKERNRAEEWLLTEFLPPKQPPCTLSDYHCDYICESRKNGENDMTDIFLCHAEKDRMIRQQVEAALERFCITSWSYDKDIKKGEAYEQAILRGIEQADNFLYFISPETINSKYCTKELKYALSLNKRIIPLLVSSIENINHEVVPLIEKLQYIDFTDNIEAKDFASDIDDILNVLRREEAYFYEHKMLLSRALKWQSEHKQPSFLLRGYNLENAKTWLRLNEKREDYAPTPIHIEFIHASEAAKGQLGTEIFISYSRKDGDFARNLNTKLQEAGKTTWFDQESISSGVDFETEIYKGIDSSDNFVFIISPDSVASEYCEREVNYAKEQNKRFITILCRETAPANMPEVLRLINWIDFENTSFEKVFPELIQSVEIDRKHAHQHTVLQQRATEWKENNQSQDFLLNATAFNRAEKWIKNALDIDNLKQIENFSEVAAKKQPAPTQLQYDFIQASNKALVLVSAKKRMDKMKMVGLIVSIIFTVIIGGLGYFAWLKGNEAEKQALIAHEAAKIAQMQKEKALIAEKASKISESEALKERERAIHSQQEAEAQAFQAQKEKERANQAMYQAQMSKELALKQEALAKMASRRAMEAQKLAEYQKVMAIKAQHEAQRRQNLSLAQTMALQAATIEIPDLSSKMARQAYIGYMNNKGSGLDFYLYNALYQAWENRLARESNNDKPFNLVFQIPKNEPIKTIWSENNEAIFASSKTIVKESKEEILKIKNGIRLLTPYQKGFIVATEKNEILFYENTSDQFAKKTFTHDKEILDFIPIKKNKIIVLYANDELILWDLNDGAKSITLQNAITKQVQGITDITYAEKQDILGVCTNNGKVLLFHIASQKSDFLISKTTANYDKLIFSKDEKQVIISTTEGKLIRKKLVDRFLQTEEENIDIFPKGHTQKINNFLLSKEGKLLITASEDKTVCVWDISRYRVQRLAVLDNFDSEPTSLSLMANGSFLYLGCKNGMVKYFPMSIHLLYKAVNHLDSSIMNDIEWEQNIQRGIPYDDSFKVLQQE